MKKVKYLIIALISFFFCYKVNALTNDGLLYEIFWDESGVNVFAKDMTLDALDYNGFIMASTSNDYTYYCIEPEIYIQNESNAVGNTHLIYETDAEIIGNSKLTTETLEKVKLLSYYGYGYKDNKVNHEGKYWYGITQVMIWRLLKPDIEFVFKESRYGNINPNLYLNEIREIQSLVDNHYKSPSFNNQRIILKKGETITLEDTNNVISNFNVKNKPYADMSVLDNKLIITAKKEINVKIHMTKQQVHNKFLLFRSTTQQNLVARGSVNIPQFYLDLSIQGKDITIKKVDKDTSLYNDNLRGSIFGLYDKDNNKIQEIEITKEVEIITLEYGNYYLKEIKASEGYTLNDKIYRFNVTSATNNLEIVMENEIIKGDLEFIKVDYSSNKPLEGVLIEVYKEDDTLIYSGKTNKDGKISLKDLAYGKYYILEKETIKYYRLSDERIDFEIKDDNIVIKKTMKNHRKEGHLEFLKIDKDSKEPLKDTTIEIYFEETNEMIFQGQTDEFGKISLNNIMAGKYYVIETNPSYGYLLNKEKLYFEIIEDEEVIALTMINEKIEIPDTNSFDNKVLLYLTFTISIIGLVILKEKNENNN